MTRTYPLAEELRALIQGVPHLTANLANASALLWDSLPDLNWVGFYLFEKDRLILTQNLQLGVLLVPDVHSFPGHIA